MLWRLSIFCRTCSKEVGNSLAFAVSLEVSSTESSDYPELAAFSPLSVVLWRLGKLRSEPDHSSAFPRLRCTLKFQACHEKSKSGCFFAFERLNLVVVIDEVRNQ